MTDDEIANRAKKLFASLGKLSLNDGLSILVTAIVNAAVQEEIPLVDILYNVEGAYRHAEACHAKARSN